MKCSSPSIVCRRRACRGLVRDRARRPCHPRGPGAERGRAHGGLVYERERERGLGRLAGRMGDSRQGVLLRSGFRTGARSDRVQRARGDHRCKSERDDRRPHRRLRFRVHSGYGDGCHGVRRPPWPEMPSEFGQWQTVYDSFARRRDAGVFTAPMDAMIAEAARRGRTAHEPDRSDDVPFPALPHSPGSRPLLSVAHTRVPFVPVLILAHDGVTNKT